MKKMYILVLMKLKTIYPFGKSSLKASFVFIFFLSLMSPVLKAQINKSEVIIELKDGSFLNGDIAYNDWIVTPSQIDFFPQDGSAKYAVNIENVAALNVIGQNRYVARKVTYDNSPNDLPNLETDKNDYDSLTAVRLLRVVIKGSLLLYEYTNKNGRQYFFVENPQHEFVTLEYKKYLEDKYLKENNKFRNQLNYFMSDCNKVSALLKTLEYDEAKLKKLFQTYFDCKRDTVTYDSRSQQPIRVFAYAGLNSSSLQFRGAYEPLSSTDFKRSLNYNLLCAFMFAKFLRFDHHRVLIEAGLKNYTFHADKIYTINSFTGNMTNTYSFNFRFTYARFQAVYRYQFLRKKEDNLFADIGYGIGLLASYNTSYTKDGMKHDNYFEPVRFDHGYLIGVGGYLHKISLMARFERASGVSPYISTKGPIRSLNLYLGYRLF